MNGESHSTISLESAGARAQFAIGIALVSIIPVLAFWYLNSEYQSGELSLDGQTISVALLLAALGFSGYLVLRKFPLNIVRLRYYLERIIRGELPEHVNLVRAEDDIRAVEQCLNLLLGQLRERLDMLQAEKKNLQEQLYQAQKMESLGVMAAGIAHDFNNILMGILTNVELLSEQVPDHPELKQGFKDVEEFVQRASDLTRKMLVYAGRGEFRMQSVDVSRLVNEMQPLLAASVGKDVALEFKLSDKLPAVTADPVQLQQVLMNLVINASDAMGGKPGKITLTSRPALSAREEAARLFTSGRLPDSECMCLEVRDNGCGMKGEQIERIFDPFFSTKPKGRGLGLAVVLGIVKSHQGAIVVESAPGAGTAFRLYLPLSGIVAPTG